MNIRIVIQLVVLVAVIYDALAMLRGLTTISATMRALDQSSGTLVRWAIVALWLHWFCPQWFVAGN